MKTLQAALPRPAAPRKRATGSPRRRRKRPAAASVATATPQAPAIPPQTAAADDISMAERLRALQARFQQVDKA